jgi:hypothetical protein
MVEDILFKIVQWVQSKTGKFINTYTHNNETVEHQQQRDLKINISQRQKNDYQTVGRFLKSSNRRQKLKLCLAPWVGWNENRGW